MKIEGKVWKSRKDQFWLAEIPLLDLMVQAESKEEIPRMLKDAIELLVDKPGFTIHACVFERTATVDAADDKLLIALALRRQRRRKKLTLEQVSEQLGAKSINEYAQYEQGKMLPSIPKFTRLLKAIDPKLALCLSISK